MTSIQINLNSQSLLLPKISESFLEIHEYPRPRFEGSCVIGWSGFNSILSTQVAACVREFVFFSTANGMYKRDYSLRMNVMEEIFRSEAVQKLIQCSVTQSDSDTDTK